MDRWTAELRRWLVKHQINPDDVSVILRAKNERTAIALSAAMIRDIEPSTGPALTVASDYDTRRMKWNGLTVSFTTLDQRV